MSKDGDYIKNCKDCHNDFIGEKIDTLCSECLKKFADKLNKQNKHCAFKSINYNIKTNNTSVR